MAENTDPKPMTDEELEQLFKDNETKLSKEDKERLKRIAEKILAEVKKGKSEKK